MNKYNNNFHFLNCTKEVINCLEEAKKIAILKNSNNIIEPIHLCLSLIFNSKLVQKILKINLYKINKQIILNTIFNNNYSKYRTTNINKLPLKINVSILEILNILNTFKYPFNSLLLFYYLWKQNPIVYSFVFTLLNIQNINILNTLKKYTYNTLPQIKIPSILNDILNIIKKDTHIIGREKEIKKINEILSRNLNRNVILLGENGVGKFSIIQKIRNNNIKKIYLSLNIINLISSYNNSTLIQVFFDFLTQYSNIILYCKNIHLLFDSSNSELNFIRSKLIEMLNLNKIQIIGTSSINLYNKMLEANDDLKFIFSTVPINEPEKHILLLIMRQYISKYNNLNKSLISDNLLETIIDLSTKFIKNYVFPKKILLVLDSMFSKANNYKEYNKENILNIISQYSELPETLILKKTSDFTNINNIELNLKKYVFGQDNAVIKIASSLKRAYIGIKDKNKPIGSWLLCGPSGTGKTELVKSLAYLLFGSEKELIRFDMSEFMEKHSVSKLIGPPPGYVGFEDGGLLTEAVKKKPYSVVLFDEIEKAHKDINNIMLQLLDEGTLTDSKGQHIDFTNTLIIYTSNLGCPSSPLEFKSFQEGTELSDKEYKFLSKNIDRAVKQFFRPEFLNRLDSLIVFKPLSIICLSNIIDKFISNLINKLKENNILLHIELDQDVKILLSKIAYHPLYGARPLKRIIEQLIEKPISELILNYKFTKQHLFSIYINKEKDTINYLLKEF